MATLLLKLRTWWETADRTQRVVSVFGTALLLALVGGTLYFASRPQMSLLYGGLSPADQGMLITELQARSIPFEQDPQGAILVPRDRVVETRALLAQAGKSPTSGHIGNESLATIGVGNTPGVESQRLRAITEGELARSIETFAGVQAARVHLNMGDDSPFASERKLPTASVAVIAKPGAHLGPAEGEAIARLVASGVGGMGVDRVTVIAGGEVLYDPQAQSGAQGIADRRLAMQVAEQRRRTEEIQRNLDRVLGPGNTVVSVDLELDYDEKTLKKLERTPSDSPVISETNVEKMGSGAAGPTGGIAGAPSNVPGSGAPATSSDSRGYEGTRKSLQYESNQTETVSKEAAGDVLRMAINVLVDSEMVKDPAKVQQYLAGYLASRSGDPNFTATVTPVPFDRTTQTLADKAAQAAAGGARTQQLFSLIPIAALVVVGFMVIKAIGKAAKSQPMMVTAVPGGQVLAFGASGGHALGAGDAHPHHSAMSHTMSHASGVPSVGPGGEMQHGVDGHGQPFQAPALTFKAPETLTEAIEIIPDKVNVPLEQLKQMAQDRPRAVAMLIQSWLLEDRR